MFDRVRTWPPSRSCGGSWRTRPGPRDRCSATWSSGRSDGASSGGWSSTASGPARSSTRSTCRGWPSPTRSTCTGAAAMPASTASPGPPTHYLGLDIGEDFDRRIVVKLNAPEVLRAELSPRRWAGEAIAMGTNTDPYQRCEGKFRLTRQVVEVLTEFANPFSILTKSTLALRDLDLIAEAARADRRPRRLLGRHPGRGRVASDRAGHAAPPPAAAGRRAVPGGGRPLRRADGARSCPGCPTPRSSWPRWPTPARRSGSAPAGPVPLHLRPGVKEHVLAWARQHRPDLAEQYERTYRGSLPARARSARSWPPASGKRWAPTPRPGTRSATSTAAAPPPPRRRRPRWPPPASWTSASEPEIAPSVVVQQPESEQFRKTAAHG